MDLQQNICPICHRELSENLRTSDYGNIVHVVCAYCGNFKITNHVLLDMLSERQQKNEPDMDMSIALRHLSSMAADEIDLKYENYEKIKGSIQIPSDPLEVLDLLMLYCGKKATRFNVGITVPKIDIPLLYVHDDNDMQALLEMAQELEYIDQYHSEQNNYVFTLKVKGWDRIIQLRKVRPESKQVFVAMSFNNKLDEIYHQGIAKAVEQCGLIPIRIDLVDFNDEIISNVLSRINQSRFLIADYTDNRPGVYFETGYAIGRGLPVIYCCRESDKGYIHFDINHYKFIHWIDVSDFKTELVKRITNTGLNT